MKLRQLIAALALWPLLTPITALGQTGAQGANQTLAQPSEAGRPHITFEDYVTQVLRSNLALAAQRSAVDLSKAAVTSAKVTPDWSVDVGLPTIDISNQGQPTNFSTGLTIPLELGGTPSNCSGRFHCFSERARYSAIELQESRAVRPDCRGQ